MNQNEHIRVRVATASIAVGGGGRAVSFQSFTYVLLSFNAQVCTTWPSQYFGRVKDIAEVVNMTRVGRSGPGGKPYRIISIISSEAAFAAACMMQWVL